MPEQSFEWFCLRNHMFFIGNLQLPNYDSTGTANMENNMEPVQTTQG